MQLIHKEIVIILCFIILCSSFTIGGTTKESFPDESIDLIDDLKFDAYCRTEQDQSRYEFYAKTLLNHDSNSSDCNSVNDNERYEPVLPGITDYVVGNDGLLDSCWPMKSQNRRHTGLSPYSTEGNNGMVKWTYEVDWIEGGIAIDNDGVLYFGDFDRYLYAMYPNGTLKWRYKTNEWIWSTPALAADGTIYIGTYGDSMYALHPNGTLKWKYWAGSVASISSSPAIAKDGTIYFGAMGPENNGRVYALNPNGTEKWHYDTGYWITSDPAIADDGTIYIGSGDSYLYALNPDGTLGWRFNTGDIVKSHPAIGDDGTIYFGSFDGNEYALNPDGTLQWKFSGTSSGAAGPAIDEDGIIFVGGDGLHALYPNGTLKWKYSFGGDEYSGHSSPAISADGTIYIGVVTGDWYAGYIYAINDDGTLKWRKKIANEGCESSPAIDTEGTVYIGSSSRSEIWGPYGTLYAFGRHEVNHAPDAPVITGTDFGFVNNEYVFNFSVHDPELDDVELFVDWDDGNTTGWLGPFDSDTLISLNYSWSSKGNYQVKAKARDTYDGSIGSWSRLTVTMPKQYVFRFPILEFLFEKILLFFNINGI